VFKALYLLYSVACQPIYIGLDSAFTSRATGIRAPRGARRACADYYFRETAKSALAPPATSDITPLFVYLDGVCSAILEDQRSRAMDRSDFARVKFQRPASLSSLVRCPCPLSSLFLRDARDNEFRTSCSDT